MLQCETLTERIIGLAIEVHRATGPGLLESVYADFLAEELELAGIPFQREVPIPVFYKGRRREKGFRADLLVDNTVIVEIEAVEALTPTHDAQLLTYLRMSVIRVGLLFNFNTLRRFLDSCTYLGYIYGERQWRGEKGLLYTWDGLHGEIEVFSRLTAGTEAPLTQCTALRSNWPERGEEFVSDILTQAATFMTLYEQGTISADDLDDFIDAWHDSGDDEQRSLAEYLGLTDEEYAVITMAHHSLPVIVAARAQREPLKEMLVPYLAELRAAANPRDRSAIYSLGHYLNDPT